jgi:arabinogalactan oligomer/maltooligosaccharide transport system permease protein
MESILYWFLTQFKKNYYWAVNLIVILLLNVFYYLFTKEFSLNTLLVSLSIIPIAIFFQKSVRGRFRIPIMMISPALLAICLLIIYPFFFELNLAFHKLNMYSIHKWMNGGDLKFVGFKNFIAVFTSSPLQTATFWELLGRTFLWTGINLVFHVGGGLALALLLNRVTKFQGLYRTLLIIPWAMPQVVAILAWRGEFHPQFGFVNQFLAQFGIEAIGWWSEKIPVFVSCVIVNVWLGIPFMMIVFLGGLQSISSSYYEAATIDGAGKWAQFKEITLPLLKPTVIPSITLGTIWTFNNINVIYLMSGGNGGNEFADILVSALYKASFTYARYSFSAAFAIVIFLILLSMTLLWLAFNKEKVENNEVA